MIRTLLIIAGASLVLAVATLGGAAALGGRDLARNGWAWTIVDGGNDSVRFERVNGAPGADAGPDVTRNLSWDGTDTLTLESIGDVTYVQGDEAGVVVTGPARAADRVRVQNGRIQIEDGEDRVVFGIGEHGIEAHVDSERLRIVVTAPSVSRFVVRGGQELRIQGYDQPSLTLDISGSGEVYATGATQALTVDIAGSGEADLSALRTTDATVDISGSGEARVAPTGRADLSISGSGEIELTTRPAQVDTDIAGSGRVVQEG